MDSYGLGVRPSPIRYRDHAAKKYGPSGYDCRDCFPRLPVGLTPVEFDLSGDQLIAWIKGAAVTHRQSPRHQAQVQLAATSSGHASINIDIPGLAQNH